MQMKVIVTGATGFVGSYMVRELISRGHDVVGTFFLDSPSPHLYPNVQLEYLDVRNKDLCNKLLSKIQPDAVVHLAGLAHTTESEENLDRLFEVNVGSVSNIANAFKLSSSKPQRTMLIVSSAFVYGGNSSIKQLQCDELTPIEPRGVYGYSKIAAESVGRMYDSNDLGVYVARPFNHIGPGQNPSFVISGFAKRIKEALDHSLIETGNLDSFRDFTDVRDIVRGYSAILEIRPDQKTFVFGSGVKRNVKEVLFEMLRLSNKTLTPQMQSHLARNESSIPIFANSTLAKNILHWQPEIPFQQSLKDILNSS
jgi:GDP-4-dehydro-6-deoxy-D-mannose reductase